MKFIYIVTKEKIENLIPLIFEVLDNSLQIINHYFDEYSLTIFYNYQSIDILEAYNILTNELYINMLIYESIEYSSEKLLKDNLENFKLVKQTYNLNYEYYNNKIIASKYYQKISKDFKKLLLSKYYNDFEIYKTITIFLEENQNVSKAAKELFLHRNTLDMRLSKFKEVTSFDLKQFKDAFLIYNIIK